MGNILLIEPNYKNKYPPIGLMKISTFHKTILNDYVRFAKGSLPAAMSKTKWDKVYVTSLFTFEWAQTIEAINYAKTLVESNDHIVVGGIAATLMPDQIYDETGIRPITGLLNETGKLGMLNDECIDQLIPDYSILDDVSYIYPYHDAYFISATKGCGMRCGFCAVQILEPTYVPYVDIKEKIAAIECSFGQKRDLLLMDNNVLRSAEFDRIIDDIIAVGFGKGASYINPLSGKQVHRFVDFNQGLDAHLLTSHKAKRLGEIALKPARIAFDHIEDREIYERAIRLCAQNGVTELSNYLLYNSERFTGKGKSYQADRPEDLYDRMRITLDLKEEINSSLPVNQKISIFSFPMRYIPLSAHERGYVGSEWNAKFLRAVQCMLIPTQGKGVGKQSFFEADFGKNSKEFIRFLCMPDKLIAARGDFIIGGRGRADETVEAAASRKQLWEANQVRQIEWNRLYDLLGEDKSEFIDQIGDNEFFPEKWLGVKTSIQKKLYLHYLTQPRLLSLLGLVDRGSPSYKLLSEYIKDEFPFMYSELVQTLMQSEIQQQHMVKNFLYFFGIVGLNDLLHKLAKDDFKADKQMEVWSKALKKDTSTSVDFELIRVYRRYVDLCILEPEQHKRAYKAILNCDMQILGTILQSNFDVFRRKINGVIQGDKGEKYISQVADLIFSSIQLKLNEVLMVSE